ncbi:hypothetical protein L6452_32405 [Arctium lappa]|uniref:Uncharacterized protein n=1 Tax=Arctium lappa TaxID=4217 RepID=A0ACB8Z3L0_ARCLA|nr:hypothetical protein L6452_32405 [Arctium lappa]
MSLEIEKINKIHLEPSYSFSLPEGKAVNHFDLLSDSLILLIFNKIGDVKALGCCCVVSKRFHTLVPHVETSLMILMVGGIVKPIQAPGQFLGPKRSSSLTVSNNIHGDDDDLEVMVNSKAVDGDEE